MLGHWIARLSSVLLATCAVVVAAQDYNVPFNPQPAGGGGEDYTARATFEGCWLMNDTSIAAGSDVVDDLCDGAGQSGEDALDSVGNTVAICSTDDLPTGTPNSANDCSADFDGTGDFLNSDTTEADDFEGHTTFTAGCWVDSDVTGGVSDGILNNSGVFGWAITSKGTTGGWAFDMNTSSQEVAGTSIPNNDWTQVVVRWDNADDAMETFTNGATDCSASCTTDTVTPSSTGELMMAENDFSSQDLDGRLYECWYASEALTDNEICQICSCGLRDNATDRNSSECGSCDMGALSCTN